MKEKERKQREEEGGKRELEEERWQLTLRKERQRRG